MGAVNGMVRDVRDRRRAEVRLDDLLVVPVLAQPQPVRIKKKKRKRREKIKVSPQIFVEIKPEKKPSAFRPHHSLVTTRKNRLKLKSSLAISRLSHHDPH